MIITLKKNHYPEFKPKNTYAAVAITKHGVEIARKLGEVFPVVDVFYMSKFEKGDEEKKGIQLFEGSVRHLFPSLFQQYKGIIAIVSLGAAIRMVAPLLKDKKTDPGIVVIDDRGENVISVLSGHLGGANELTHEVAAALGANPIITTASDVGKTIPVDIFGKRFGWTWESAEKLTPVSAAVVNEEQIVIVQESGEKNWWMYDSPMPAHIKVCSKIQEALETKPDAALVITHRILTEEEEKILQNGVLYRPKVLVLGMGCNRGTSSEEIEAVIKEALQELNFSIHSVKGIATIDLKKDEEGFLAVIEKYGWEFNYYSANELNEIKIDTPSETVFKYTGAYGVSEPAAMVMSGADELLLKKKKSGNVTISIALIDYGKVRK